MSASTNAPLCNGTPGSLRHCFVKAACAVAEGAAVRTDADASASASASAFACVSAVLGDAERRVCVLGGREGMPRSIGSVYAGAITLFLGSLLGIVRRTFTTFNLRTVNNGIAVTRDGNILLSGVDACTRPQSSGSWASRPHFAASCERR
jgi:hypothetical protein